MDACFDYIGYSSVLGLLNYYFPVGALREAGLAMPLGRVLDRSSDVFLGEGVDRDTDPAAALAGDPDPDAATGLGRRSPERLGRALFAGAVPSVTVKLTPPGAFLGLCAVAPTTPTSAPTTPTATRALGDAGGDAIGAMAMAAPGGPLSEADAGRWRWLKK